MSKFIQLHILTSYPPANLNRDDMGRPKTAKMGGVDRLRISSQSLKRAWRTSDLFKAAMNGHIGTRTKKLGLEIHKKLIDGGVKPEDAKTWARSIAEVFGKLCEKAYSLPQKGMEKVKELCEKVTSENRTPEDGEIEALKKLFDLEDPFGKLVKQHTEKSKPKKKGVSNPGEKDIGDWKKSLNDLIEKLQAKRNDEDSKENKGNDLEIAQLVFLSPKEQEGVDSLLKTLISQKRSPKDEELNLLRKTETAVDIALFGRMLASNSKFDVEAACQVAHSISVHPVVIEDDYFTAVDDLNEGDSDRGAAHIGETGFASALFYTYVCIDKELLTDNLGNNRDLANKAIAALLETAVKVAPEGKQNSFASRAWASYVLAEKGNDQPRSLSVAFLKPISGSNYGEDAIAEIKKTYENMNKVYEVNNPTNFELNAITGEKTFSGLKSFVAE